MTFDTSVHLSDLLIFGGGIAAFVKVWLAMRDDVRDNKRDIMDLQTVSKSHEQELEEHTEALHRMGWQRRVTHRHLDGPRDE